MKLFNLLKKDPKKAGTFAHVKLLNRRNYCGSVMEHIQDIDMHLFRNAWISKTPILMDDKTIVIRDKTSDVSYTVIHLGKKNFSVTQSGVLREEGPKENIQVEKSEEDIQIRLNRIIDAYFDEDSDDEANSA